MMDWNDTIGQCITANLFNTALNNKPDADKAKLTNSILHLTSVGITRKAIADVLYAEVECLTGLKAIGEPYPLDFIAGLLCAADLVSNGTHVTDNKQL